MAAGTSAGGDPRVSGHSSQLVDVPGLCKLARGLHVGKNPTIIQLNCERDRQPCILDDTSGPLYTLSKKSLTYRPWFLVGALVALSSHHVLSSAALDLLELCVWFQQSRQVLSGRLNSALLGTGWLWH